jgi:tRNA G46 methylase TrmB
MPVRRPMSRSVYASRLAEYQDFALAEDAVLLQLGRWREFFERRIGKHFNGRVILEVGCFDAQFLASIAAEHPRTAFIGIDWKCKPIYDGASRIAELALRNILLLRARANDLLSIFSPRELDEIWIFHPDPCDKETELKNRLVAKPFLLAAHQVLKDSTSLLSLKTDHLAYYQSVMDLLRPGGDPAVAECFEIAAESVDFWHDAVVLSHTASRDFSGKTTLFERRFIRRRVPISYLELRKFEPRQPKQ